MASPTHPETEQIFAMLERASSDSFYKKLLSELGLATKRGIYSVEAMIWLMIFQRLHPKGTIAVAVEMMVRSAKGPAQRSASASKRVREGKISTNTSGYCQARRKLPTLVVKSVTEHIFEQLRQQMPAPEGPPVYVVDGTTITLAHDKELVEAFPPGRNQHGENHWPVLMVVALHDARTGLAAPPCWGPMYGPNPVSEQALAKQALVRVPADATLLTDGNFGIFWFIYAVQQSGRPVVSRLTEVRAKSLLHQVMPTNGTRQKVTWKPSSYERRAHPELPPDASVEGWVVVCQNPSDPAKKLYLFTTLDWEPERVVAIYTLRWNIETDLRSLKQTVHLQRITSKSRGVVEKELLMAFAAYNLVRAVMYVAACREGIAPRDLSFSLSQNAVMGAWGDLQRATTKTEFKRRMELMISMVSKAKLPRRKNRRSYPREIWGRGGHFPYRKSGPAKEPAK